MQDENCCGLTCLRNGCASGDAADGEFIKQLCGVFTSFDRVNFYNLEVKLHRYQAFGARAFASRAQIHRA